MPTMILEADTWSCPLATSSFSLLTTGEFLFDIWQFPDEYKAIWIFAGLF